MPQILLHQVHIEEGASEMKLYYIHIYKDGDDKDNKLTFLNNIFSH